MWFWTSPRLGFFGLLWTALASPLVLAQAVPSEGLVGVRSTQVAVPERGPGRVVDLTHWYPAAPGGSLEQVGANAVFLGTPALRNAPVAHRQLPLVFLSHGGLRVAQTMGAWLAAGLAQRGYWVVQVHAPVLKPSDAGVALQEAWLRPTDISAAVTAARQDPLMHEHTLDSKVGVVGLMRGGTSAVMLIGGRLNPSAHAQMCDGPVSVSGPDCAWFEDPKSLLRAVDPLAVGQSRRDPRVGVAVVVSPELGTAFSETSLAGMGVPVHFLSLGQSKAVPSYLDASRLARLVPGATHQTLAQANVFSAFAPCTEKAAFLLREEGEDPALCEEAGGRPRRSLHAEMVALIDAALRSSMGVDQK